MKHFILFLSLFLSLTTCLAQSILGPSEVTDNQGFVSYSINGWSCSNTTGCLFNFQVYYLPPNNGIPVKVIDNLNQGSNNLSINYSSLFSSNGSANENPKYFKVESWISGCSTNTCNTVHLIKNVTVNKGIGAVGLINGASSKFINCGSTSTVNFNVSPVSGAISYSWTIPAGWVLVNGQGTNSINVTPSATGGQGQNVCVVANGKGSSSTGLNVSPPRCISIDRGANPAMSVGIPAGNLCNNGTKSLSASPVSNIAGATYTWVITNGNLKFLSNNATTITTTTPSVTVKAPSTGGGVSWVKVAVNTPCGNSAYSSNYQVSYGGAQTTNVADTYDPCVNIFQIQDIASQPLGVTYAWTANSGGTFIGGTGNTKAVKTPTNNNASSFNYTVTLTHSCGSITDYGYVLYSTCSSGKMANQAIETSVLVSPNPTTGRVTLSIPNESAAITTDIMLFDMQGKQILRETKLINEGNNELEYDLTHLPKGMYVFHIKIGNEVSTQKLIVD